MAQLMSNAEMQHDEIEALRSIYMDDFQEHESKPGAWNVGYTMKASLPSHVARILRLERLPSDHCELLVLHMVYLDSKPHFAMCESGYS